MRVTAPPDRFIDEQDGQPIKQLEPEGSRYEQIAIKRLDDGVEIRAKEVGVEEPITLQATLNDQMFRGVTLDDDTRRRDLDDDLLDALHLVGYCLIDESTRGY